MLRARVDHHLHGGRISEPTLDQNHSAVDTRRTGHGPLPDDAAAARSMHNRSLDDSLRWRRQDPTLHDLWRGRRRCARLADVVIVGQARQRLPASRNSLTAAVALDALVRRCREWRQSAALAAPEIRGVGCRRRQWCGDGARDGTGAGRHRERGRQPRVVGLLRDGTRAGRHRQRSCQPRVAFFLLSTSAFRFLLLVLQAPSNGFVVLHGVKPWDRHRATALVYSQTRWNAECFECGPSRCG